MAKAFGRDINKFYNTSFPANHCIDDDADWIEQYVSGDTINLPEYQKFELSDFGILVNEETGSERSFASAFQRWQKQQTTATIVVEVQAVDKEDAIIRLKELGFKVVK